MSGAIMGDIAGSVYEAWNTKDYNFDVFPRMSNFTDDTIMFFFKNNCTKNNYRMCYALKHKI